MVAGIGKNILMTALLSQPGLTHLPPVSGASGVPGRERRQGDFKLNPDTGYPQTLKAAAVLIPLVSRPSGPTILLTRRNSRLRKHAGQISFPGGRVDDTDHSPAHTALRETAEEIGLPFEAVQIQGYLTQYVTGTGYDVAPVVGWIDHLPSLTLNAAEVDHVFEMPLAYILDPQNRQQRTVLWNKILHRYYVYDFEHRYIWGATAGILSELSEKIRHAIA